MRVMFAICAGILMSTAAVFGETLPVSGQVVDSTARPVEGAEVAVYEQYLVGLQDYDARLAAPIVRTDAQGRFTLEADISSQYGTFIVARRQGLALAWDGLNYGGNHKSKGHFLLVMEAPNEMVGQVVDSSGNLVVGAQVQVLPVTSYLSRLSQRPILAPKEWFTTTTDEQGRFRIGQLAADVSASFRVQPPDQTCTYVVRANEMNSCGFEVWRSDIRLQLPLAGIVRGRVTDGRGRPVADVDLRIVADPANRDGLTTYLPQETRSDREGAFIFDGIPAGKSRIDVLTPDGALEAWVGQPVQVSVRAGQTKDRVTVGVAKGGLLEVRVLNEQTGRPAPDAQVHLNSGQWRRDTPAVANTDGVATARVPEGEFSVYVTKDGLASYQSTEQIAAGQTLRFDATLAPEVLLEGRVLTANGEPAQNAIVSAHPFGDHVHTDRSGRFQAATDERHDADGGYVVARDLRQGAAVASKLRDSHESLELNLAPAWTLTGMVVDLDGVGIPAARVSLCLDTRNCLSDLGVEVLTDSQGRYEMMAIPPVQEGFTYRLSFAAAGYGPQEYQSISATGAPGDRVDVGPTELLRADQAVSGVVVDPNGMPAAHVPIFVNGLVGVSQPSKATSTDETGAFAFRRLCEGPIRLQASFSSRPGGAGFLRAELPAENLKIILGEERSHEPEVSIMGKPLPTLDALGLSSLDIAGKPALICFFDYQQRPSRNCVLQLVRQAGVLEQRGVGVAIVQASQADASALKDWAGENCPAFALGSIAGNVDSVRAAWGVKALPWLILTDNEHRVTAEGFSAAEIGDLIE